MIDQKFGGKVLSDPGSLCNFLPWAEVRFFHVLEIPVYLFAQNVIPVSILFQLLLRDILATCNKIEVYIGFVARGQRINQEFDEFVFVISSSPPLGDASRNPFGRLP